jgi:predicted enzyme related to lactoylglutathione lyase
MSGVVDAGGSRVKEPQDVGGGRLVAVVADPEGNRIGLIQDPA